MSSSSSSSSSSGDRPMIWTVKTDNAGVAPSDTYRMPLINGSCDIDWGDGNISRGVTGGNQRHTYASAGTYTLKIWADAPINFRNNLFGDLAKMLEVQQWGDIPFNSMQAFFYGCSNMTITATDAPDMSNVTTMLNAFNGCAIGPNFPTNWDLSGVENFSGTWQNCVNMTGGFDSYDLSSATSLNGAWAQLSSPNPRLGLKSWNCTTSTALTDIRNAWNRCNLENCGGTGVGVFPYFEMSNVTDAYGAWELSFLKNFNSSLDFSSVTDAGFTFQGISLSGVAGEIFPAFDFTSVQNAEEMFNRCANIRFSTHPRLIAMTDGTNCFQFGKGMNNNDPDIYNDFLIDMEANNPNNNVNFHAGTSQYYETGRTARDILTTSPRDWTITDGGDASESSSSSSIDSSSSSSSVDSSSSSSIDSSSSSSSSLSSESEGPGSSSSSTSSDSSFSSSTSSYSSSSSGDTVNVIGLDDPTVNGAYHLDGEKDGFPRYVKETDADNQTTVIEYRNQFGPYSFEPFYYILRIYQIPGSVPIEKPLFKNNTTDPNSGEWVKVVDEGWES